MKNRNEALLKSAGFKIDKQYTREMSRSLRRVIYWKQGDIIIEYSDYERVSLKRLVVDIVSCAIENTKRRTRVSYE